MIAVNRFNKTDFFVRQKRAVVWPLWKNTGLREGCLTIIKWIFYGARYKCLFLNKITFVIIAHDFYQKKFSLGKNFCENAGLEFLYEWLTIKNLKIEIEDGGKLKIPKVETIGENDNIGFFAKRNFQLKLNINHINCDMTCWKTDNL